MQAEPIEAQDEPRTSAVTVRVTASEKRAFVLVSAARGVAESDLLMPMIPQIVAEAEHIRTNLPNREDAA